MSCFQSWYCWCYVTVMAYWDTWNWATDNFPTMTSHNPDCEHGHWFWSATPTLPCSWILAIWQNHENGGIKSSWNANEMLQQYQLYPGGNLWFRKMKPKWKCFKPAFFLLTCRGDSTGCKKKSVYCIWKSIWTSAYFSLDLWAQLTGSKDFYGPNH